MMNIYDCATYFIAFNRYAHHKPTYTLHNFYNALYGCSCSSTQPKYFKYFISRAIYCQWVRQKSHIVWHACTAPRTDVKISATHIYTHSPTASCPCTHRTCIYIPSSLFIVGAAYVDFRMTSTACSIFFYTHIAIVFAVFWSHYSIHLTASGTPLPIALLFTIYR